MIPLINSYLQGALCMTELGTIIPKNGAEYTYILVGIGEAPAFLSIWSLNLLLKPAGLAIIALTCSEYLLVLPFEDGCGEPPELNKKLLAAVILIVLAAINCYSVKLATRIQVIFTVAKLLAVFMIIIGGFVRLGQGYTDSLKSGFKGTTTNVGKIALGIYSGLWSYDGWNNLNYATGELKEPHKNLPRSIMLGIPLVIVCYVLMNISYFTVMSPSKLLNSPAVAVTWAEAVIRPVKWLIPIFVALSTFGSANGIMFGTSRCVYYYF
ncbi:DgyrCDS814 [Dimorphilus gyrociliatus]|uniref:DgyrCDS814 n=1 Tax=Dimorphilus gyrociliatus TaxID=2664684 RepID=A0A7I8V8B0_9ANNE|nr:DgyrCDS814 [Dimorphilus gyrociliatus]